MISILMVKKGAKVRLRGTGWLATVMDNTVKQHTRVCDVEGFEREMGSVYSTDIVSCLNENTGCYEAVMHTEGQLKALKQRKAMGF